MWWSPSSAPRISVTEAAEAMKLLLSLGLLVRDPESGRVQRGEPTLTTEHEVRLPAERAVVPAVCERGGDAEMKHVLAMLEVLTALVCAGAERRSSADPR